MKCIGATAGRSVCNTVRDMSSASLRVPCKSGRTFLECCKSTASVTVLPWRLQATATSRKTGLLHMLLDGVRHIRSRRSVVCPQSMFQLRGRHFPLWAAQSNTPSIHATVRSKRSALKAQGDKYGIQEQAEALARKDPKERTPKAQSAVNAF
eukprot:6180213-Pleurochrysis_carterae.AAC.9